MAVATKYSFCTILFTDFFQTPFMLKVDTKPPGVTTNQFLILDIRFRETSDIKSHLYFDLHFLTREILIVEWQAGRQAFMNNHMMDAGNSFKVRQMLTWGGRDLPGLKGIEGHNGNAVGGGG